MTTERPVVLALSGDDDGIVGFNVKADIDRDGCASRVKPILVQLTPEGRFFCGECFSENACQHASAAASTWANAVAASVSPEHATWLAQIPRA